MVGNLGILRLVTKLVVLRTHFATKWRRPCHHTLLPSREAKRLLMQIGVSRLQTSQQRLVQQKKGQAPRSWLPCLVLALASLPACEAGE